MKQRNVITLLLFATLFAGFGCTTTSTPIDASEDESAYNKAKQEDSVTAYEKFLTDHPGSPIQQMAVYYRDRAALYDAKRINTPDAFRAFIEKHPNSDWLEQARYFLKYGVPSDDDYEQPVHTTPDSSPR